MKNLFIAALAALATTSCSAQTSNFKEKTVFRNDDVEFHQIDEHTWHGNGHLVYNESIYLIEGETSAILLDAGTKIPNLKKIVENIVKKPVTLIATHVHGDHTGSAVNEWDTIWINAADEVNVPKNMPNYKGTKMYLTDGQVFDLGGRQIEVVFTPGHTPGSTTFIDKKAHYGFSSDAFGSENLLVFTDLSTQISTCNRMMRFVEKYDIKYFYPGHYWGHNLETPERIKDIAELCEDILAGKKAGEPTGQANGLNHILNERGVRINYGAPQMR